MKISENCILSFCHSLLGVFLAVLILTGISSCKDKSGIGAGEEVRDYFVAYCKKDTCELSRTSLETFRKIDCSTDSGVNELRSAVNVFTRNELASGHNFSVIKYMRDVIEIVESHESRSLTDAKLLLGAYIYMGAALQSIGMSSLSLDYYNKGLALAQGKELQVFKAMLLNNIGVLYSDAGECEKAISYLSQSLEYNTKEGYNPGLFLNNINLSMVYEKEAKIDSALEVSLKAMHYIVEKEQPEDFYAAQLLLGQLYAKKGDYNLAMSFLHNGQRRLEKIGYIPGVLEAYQKLSKAYSLRNMPDSANLFASRALKLSQSIDAHSDETTSLVMLADVFADKGDYRQAAQLLRTAVALEDSMRTEENRLRLLQWEGLGGGMTPGTTSDDRRFESLSTGVIIAGVCITAIAIIFIILYFRTRFSLLGRGREYDEKNAALSKELDLRNREHTTLALDKIKSREGIENLCEDLRAVILELNPKATAQKSRLKELLGKLDRLSSEMNDDFRQSFERVHPDFYRLVKERYPSLTAKEERLCAFIYLGLSTKEIAALTWREVRSVESSRNRLRKKLQLEVNDDLCAHLKTIAP